MKIKFSTHRGVEVCDVIPEIGEPLYNKLTGRTNEPLLCTLRAFVPNTFAELGALWNKGKLGYSAFEARQNTPLAALSNFDPAAEEIIFV